MREQQKQVLFDSLAVSLGFGELEAPGERPSI
jgi:hypothetical protein